MNVFKVNSPLSIRGRLKRPARPASPQKAAPVTGPSPLSYRDTRQADEAVPFALRVAAAAAWRLILVGVVIYGCLWLLGLASTVVIPVAVALLLTALVMPLAVFLNHRLKFPRPLASITTILISLSVVVGL
ncbi:MAG: AI-2E family transporter, partial [Mobilicoccus sp.]|nr:AI-2E family transporter [Mobilicoccus sp.]